MWAPGLEVAQLCSLHSPPPSSSRAVERDSPAPFHPGLCCGATNNPMGHQGPGAPLHGLGAWKQPSPRYSPRSSLTNFLSSIASCPFRLGRQLRKQSEQGNCRRPRGSIPPGSVVPPGPSSHEMLIYRVPNQKVPIYGVPTVTLPCRPQHSSPKN